MENHGERTLLERFVVNNPDLEHLESLLAEFNIFETLGAVRQELRHSDFLAFLLDPGANHRLGDAFLKRLLKRILVSVSEPPVSAVEIDAADLTGAQVSREWQRIDILVRDPSNRLVCVIENKIGSSEHSDQLRRYKKTSERDFTGQRIVFVYLTPEGDAPSNDTYIALGYGAVAGVMDAVRRARESTLGAGVSTLMEHYTTMLRRHIVTESEIVTLCRKLYQQHKQALDLIYEHRPDLQYDMYKYLQSLVQKSATEYGLSSQHSGKSQVHFTVKDWDAYPAQRAGEGPRERILTFRFYNDMDQIHLRFMIGPGPQRVRRALLREFQKHSDLFNHARGQVGRREKTVYQKKGILNKSDYEDPDPERMRAKIQKWWQKFLEGDLVEIRAVVADLPWEALAEAAETSED